jgi:hypothetical protein
VAGSREVSEIIFISTLSLTTLSWVSLASFFPTSFDPLLSKNEMEETLASSREMFWELLSLWVEVEASVSA